MINKELFYIYNMLSICIPIYNFDVNITLKTLEWQCQQLNIVYEIVLIDDASTTKWDVNLSDNISYLPLEKNIGRASIRNLLAEKAKFANLLFLDCDVKIIHDDFIEKYIAALKKNNTYEIICGGRIYPAECPSEKQFLSWNYGIKRESKSAEERAKNPNKSFMTNNFLIKKNVFEKVKFNEAIKGYGHEDTLFGFELAQNNFKILHIENPVLNGDIETNVAFLQKTNNAIANLKKLRKSNQINAAFFKQIQLIKVVDMISALKLSLLIKTFQQKIVHYLHEKLVKQKTNILWFDLYKICYYLSC